VHTGSRGEVPGERKPVIRHNDIDDDDDDDDNNNNNKATTQWSIVLKELTVIQLIKKFAL
jgi:hypothetical protein